MLDQHSAAMRPARDRKGGSSTYADADTVVATNFWQFIDRFEILAHFQLGNFAAAQSQLLPRGQIMISCW